MAVDVKGWIRQFQRIQQIVKHLAVGLEIQRLAVGGTEHLPGGPLPYPLIDDVLDLGRDGDGAALARIRFRAAGKAALRAVIIGHIQCQELRGAEAEVALRQHIVRAGDAADGFPDGLQIVHRQADASGSLVTGDRQILRQVKLFREIATGDAVLIDQARRGFHVPPGGLPTGAIVKAVL